MTFAWLLYMPCSQIMRHPPSTTLFAESPRDHFVIPSMSSNFISCVRGKTLRTEDQSSFVLQMPSYSLAPRRVVFFISSCHSWNSATAATQIQQQTSSKICRAHLDPTSTVFFIVSWCFVLPGIRRCCTYRGSSTRSRHACCTALLHSRQGCTPNPRHSTSSLCTASRHKCKGDQVQSPPCAYQTHNPISPLTTSHSHSSELLISSWIFPTVAHLRSSSFSLRSRI